MAFTTYSRKAVHQICDGNVTRGSVVLQPSVIPGAGRGVFVPRGAPAGAVLCYYHGVKYRGTEELTREQGQYAIGLDEDDGGGCIVGYSTPQPSHPGGIAQLMNDGARPIIGPDVAVTVKELGAAMVQYMVQSSARCNVQSQEGVFVASRELLAGEELYFGYGERYWIDDIRWTHRHPQTQKVALVLLAEWLRVLEQAGATADDAKVRVVLMRRCIKYLEAKVVYLDLKLAQLRAGGESECSG